MPIETTIRFLEAADVPAAMTLKSAAGWNQSRDDWIRLMGLRPGGCFAALCDGELAGTVTTLEHEGGPGWIGMMLVHPALRGKGIGRRLLDAALESLSFSATVKLDATPAGRRIYAPAGFADEALLERWGRPPGPAPHAASGDEGAWIRALDEADLPSAALLDRPAFGAGRVPVLAAWHAAAPSSALAAGPRGAIQGFLLARPGSRALHLGPIVAERIADAEALLARALGAARWQAVIIDTFTANLEWLEVLRDFGFSPERGFVRMRLGPAEIRGRTEHQWATAGPEVG